MNYSPNQKKILIDLARASIQNGLTKKAALSVDASKYELELQKKRATFVTLKLDHELRGCIGMLEAVRPLVMDVVQNAFAAAFRDSRFAPVTKAELDEIQISISVLTPPEPVLFASEQDLLSKIRPGVDGLILTEGPHRGTFLPAVWEDLTDPQDFLRHLKLKAGLSVHYWSDKIQISRYTAVSVS